jgi:phosphoglycolate phosphatase
LIERCLSALARPAEDLGAVFERFLVIYRARSVETTCLYPGMREALDEIAKHAKLAVLTNKPGDLSRAIVRELGIAGRFIEVIGGDDLGTKKPDPEGLLKLSALAGAGPEETALVGDSAVDVITARQANALAIGALWGYDRAGVELERPDIAVRAPKDVARLFSPEPSSPARPPR